MRPETELAGATGLVALATVDPGASAWVALVGALAILARAVAAYLDARAAALRAKAEQRKEE